jgi:DNA primase
MNLAHPTRGKFQFRRDRLPAPGEYYRSQKVVLAGSGAWRNAICPFHEDKNPSLRVRLESGAFRCMVCGAKGGDVLAFHQLKYGLSFIAAAKDLGCWGVDQ